MGQIAHKSHTETRLCIHILYKATTIIYAKLLFKEEFEEDFLFFESKTAFDVDREQEMATAMENQNFGIISASVTLLGLSTVFVVLRLLSRKLSKAGYWVSMRFIKSKDQADD